MHSSKKILSKSEAEEFVMTFQVRKFAQQVSPVATVFLRPEQQQSSFKIDPLLAQQTGIAQLQKAALEEQIEQRAIEKLQEIQEAAYQEAYQIGLEEGRVRAFETVTEQIKIELDSLSALVETIEDLKSKLIVQNEIHFVHSISYIAERIARREIESNPAIILELLLECVKLSQSEEKIKIFLNPQDHEFITSQQSQLGSRFEFLKKAEWETSEDIERGGCIVETNYGRVDAQIKTRVQKVFETFADRLPLAKNRIGPDDQS